MFDKSHGYALVRNYVNSLVSECFNKHMSWAQREQNFLYVLALDPINGIADTSLFPLDYFTRNPYLFKSKKKGNDPDSPGIMEALTGPHRTEFLEAMKTEIEELEHHGTWKVIQREEIPEEIDKNGNKSKPKVLLGTWVYKIKRFPSRLLWKIKARFCARGDLEEDVDVYDT